MSKFTEHIWDCLSHFKYHITIVAGVAIVGFLDEDSIVKRFKNDYQISELKEEIAKYNKRYEADSKTLRNLERNPSAISKIARERYFMKADDEEVFVLSDDERLQETLNTNETAK